VTDILKNIAWSFEQISIRFQAVKTSDDFIKDDIGFEKLDSICMQLINVGEALKQVDKLTDGKLLVTYPTNISPFHKAPHPVIARRPTVDVAILRKIGALSRFFLFFDERDEDKRRNRKTFKRFF